MRDRKQKGYVILLLILFTFYLTVPTTLAANATKDAAKTIKVGYFPQIGYQNSNPDGTYSGYNVDYLQKIAEYTGWNYEFVPGSWSDCLQWLKEGKIDLMGFMLKTEARECMFDYSTFDCGSNSTKLFTLDTNQSYAEDSWLDYNGISVGFVRGSVIVQQFSVVAKEKGISYQANYYDTEDALATALETGEVDAICSGMVQVPQNLKILAMFHSQPIYFTTAKGNSELLAELNDAMAQMEVDFPEFQQSLREKHFIDSPNPNEKIVFSQAEKQYLKQASTIKVVIENNLLPIEGFDKEGQPTGITVSILKEISRISGLNFEFVNGGTYLNCVNLLKQGQVNMSTTYDPHSNLLGDANLTDPYFSASMVYLGRKDYQYDPAKTTNIILTPRTEYFKDTLLPRFRNAEFSVLSEDDNDYCKVIAAGKADLLLRNVYTGQSRIATDYPKLSILYDSGYLIDYCFAFQKETPKELISIMNKSISHISKADMNSMVLSNSLAEFDTSKEMRKIILVSILAAVASILACIFFQRGFSAQRKLIYQAHYDELTGAKNLRKFKTDAQKLLLEHPDKSYVLEVFDVKKFQLFNSLNGTDDGDKLLKQITNELNKVIKKHETFGRVSKDEFVLLSEGDGHTNSSVHLEEVLKHFNQNDTNFEINFTRGLYSLEPGEKNMDVAFEKASQAHRLAKKTENTDVYRYNEGINQLLQKELIIENCMHKALANRDFAAYLQPQYDPVSETIIAAEALVRWVNEDKIVYYPDEFIYLFENNGFIIQLDKYIFKEVCRLLKEWSEQGLQIVPISVNFSKRHLNNPNFIRELQAIAADYDVPCDRITIELTESVAVEMEGFLQDVLREIRSVGFKLSIDDFGAGYSSLSLLKSMRVDEIKLDRSFFSDLIHEKRSRDIIESIIAMSKKLDIATVAEGIEEATQVEYLREIQCEKIQGYYYAKPMPAQEFAKKLNLLPLGKKE